MTDNYKRQNPVSDPERQRNAHIQRRRKQRKRRNRMIVFVLLLIITFVGVFLFFIFRNHNPLIGTWVYDSYTQYVFTKDGNGCLEADDVHYEYTYEIHGDTLTMDFVSDVVRDCEYTFSVRNNELTLIGGDNTDGGTYTLHKN